MMIMLYELFSLFACIRIESKVVTQQDSASSFLLRSFLPVSIFLPPPIKHRQSRVSILFFMKLVSSFIILTWQASYTHIPLFLPLPILIIYVTGYLPIASFE